MSRLRHSERLVAYEVANERRRQREQWGFDNDRLHSVAMWYTILGVHMGKLLAEGLDPVDSTAVKHPDQLSEADRAALRSRAVKVAAVASALAEQLVPR